MLLDISKVKARGIAPSVVYLEFIVFCAIITMSMLAEPRRRKTYVLTPKGKPLYEDDGRYGSKMLQKMGWTKGKGLGAKESGETDFVRVNFKSDSGGLGFEHRDDQWTKHEHGFNGLLQSLNATAGEEEKDDTKKDNEEESLPTVGFGFMSEKMKEKKKIKVALSGESLEEKSKKSKARVHYKKFTRGKDLSQYSEKDLANIFGKKSLEETENELEDQANCFLENKSTSIADYFKQKMEKLNGNQNRFRNSLVPAVATVQMEGDQEQSSNSNSITDYFKKKMEERIEKQKESKVKKDKEIEINEQMTENFDEEPIRKKRKKDKKTSTKETLLETEELSETYFPAKEEKRKKKRKTEVEISCQNSSECNSQLNEPETDVENRIKYQTEENVSPVAKKSKKIKSTTLEHSTNNANDTSKAITTPSTQPILDVDVFIYEGKSTNNAEHSPDENLDNEFKDLNVYTISSYAAEIFRHFDFNWYKGSNLAHVNGYSFDKDMKLQIKKNIKDEERIMQLWSGTDSKYNGSKQKTAYKVSNTENTSTVNSTKPKSKNRAFIRSKHKRRSAFKMSF